MSDSTDLSLARFRGQPESDRPLFLAAPSERIASALERIAAALEAANEREAREAEAFRAIGQALTPTGEPESLQERLIAERQRG